MSEMNVSIDVMTWTDTKGEQHPVRIKMQHKGKKSQVIKIDKILSSEKAIIDGVITITYKCQCIIDNIRKIYDLSYSPEGTGWALCG